ncbi:MAG: glycosyltransferase family 2 protein [Candidatus Saccharibacteria bacterium]|jgi:dolichol-phosphate mannosyltransferase|nr:MAG: glycosyltransferase family 2 protein [Candidatus Saccharibacteria bacterium]
MHNKTISIVIPIYNESPNVALLYKTIKSTVKKLPQKFELIFVDDGSSDDSVKKLRGLAKKDRGARVVELARNFGKEIAVTAGLHTARGDAAIIMDADLQHPPELLPAFVKEWENGADVVVGVKRYSKDESWFKKLTSNGFYALLRRVSSSNITPHASDFRLIDRPVIDTFKTFTERNRITRGIIDWSGFERRYIYFEAPPRRFGEAGYSYRKLFALAMNSFAAYSMLPLKFASWLGWFILFVSSGLGLFTIIEKYVLGDPMNLEIRGTAMLAIMLLFLIGVVLICLGFVAMYIARIHEEVINRPLYIVKNEENGDEA